MFQVAAEGSASIDYHARLFAVGVARLALFPLNESRCRSPAMIASGAMGSQKLLQGVVAASEVIFLWLAQPAASDRFPQVLDLDFSSPRATTMAGVPAAAASMSFGV